MSHTMTAQSVFIILSVSSVEDATKTNAGSCTYTPGQALCSCSLRPGKPAPTTHLITKEDVHKGKAHLQDVLISVLVLRLNLVPRPRLPVFAHGKSTKTTVPTTARLL